jgi:hypothetical protein
MRGLGLADALDFTTLMAVGALLARALHGRDPRRHSTTSRSLSRALRALGGLVSTLEHLPELRLGEPRANVSA